MTEFINILEVESIGFEEKNKVKGGMRNGNEVSNSVVLSLTDMSNTWGIENRLVEGWKGRHQFAVRPHLCCRHS